MKFSDVQSNNFCSLTNNEIIICECSVRQYDNTRRTTSARTLYNRGVYYVINFGLSAVSLKTFFALKNTVTIIRLLKIIRYSVEYCDESLFLFQ